MNKDHANVADVTNNQQRLKNIKNMCVTDKTGLAVCKCDFKINNEKNNVFAKVKSIPPQVLLQRSVLRIWSLSQENTYAEFSIV